MKASLFVCAMLFAFGSRVVCAGDLPDAKTLRDLSLAASGPVPNTSREIIEFTGTAASGKTVIYRRGADARTVVDAGLIHTESGVRAGERWHENANGHVVMDQDDPGLATGQRLTTTVTRSARPVDAFVVSELNSKGSGTRDYFDPVSHYRVRHEVLTPNGTNTTVYDDFRGFGNRHLAAHWSTHNATTGTESQSFVREYVADAVTDGDVAIPAMKRALVEYPPDVNRVVLPSVFEPSGHIVVRVTINGRGLDLLLDSGSSSITLDPGVASQLGLTVIAKEQSSANAGRFATGEAIVPAISVGALTMHNAIVSIVPLSGYEPGVKTVGLLGFDFLCESGITIDYEHKTVTAERYGTYAAPHEPRTIALEARLGEQIPMTTVNINGAVAERVMLDTGAVGPFMLFGYFQRRHPEALPRPGLDTALVNFTGAGGAFQTRSVVLDTVGIGNVSFKRFTGYVVQSESSYSFAADGVIGPDLLRIFDVHLDYPNGMVYLVPNESGKRALH